MLRPDGILRHRPLTANGKLKKNISHISHNGAIFLAESHDVNGCVGRVNGG